MFSEESKENPGSINTKISHSSSNNQETFHPLQDLQNGCPEGVDPANKEMWLSGFRNISKDRTLIFLLV